MQKTELKNLMEILVECKYEEVKDALEVCTCDQCRLDVLSYALNRLPAKYVVTDKGEALAKVSSMSLQFDSDILCALTMGAKIVREHPRH